MKPYGFEITRHHLTLTGLRDPLRIAHLSDLHYGFYNHERDLRKWVDATLEESPDLILITGDFVDHFIMRGLKPLEQELSRLKAPLGIYGVWGNHDYDSRRLKGLKRVLPNAGVTILINEGRAIRDDLYLAGVDDLKESTPNLLPALEGRPDNSACILMSHNPDILPDVPKTVNLTLSGHTHGGQVKFPFVGAIKTASKYGKRFLEGWIDDPVKAYVSRGLGFSMLPIRFGSPSELAIFDLSPV